MYSVYSLIDPRDDLPFYIGITDDVYKRFAQHLQCNGTNLDKNERIQELKDEGLMLIMRTIEVLETLEQAREREQHWIHYYLSRGLRLLNIDINRSFTYEDFQAFFEPKQKRVRQLVDPSRGGKARKAASIIRRNPQISAPDLAKKAQISTSYARKLLAN